MPAHPIRTTEPPPFGRAFRTLPGPFPQRPEADARLEPAGNDFLVMNHHPDLTAEGEPMPPAAWFPPPAPGRRP